MDHKDGRLAFRHVNGPARTTHGRNGLRCVDLEFPAARLDLNVKQQGLAAQRDGVDATIMIGVAKDVLRAILGDDGNAALALQGLRDIRRTGLGALNVCLLRDGGIAQQQPAHQHDTS
jgi:hypothetical protein